MIDKDILDYTQRMDKVCHEVDIHTNELPPIEVKPIIYIHLQIKYKKQRLFLIDAIYIEKMK